MLKKYIKDDRLRNIAEWVLCLIAAYLIYLVLNRFIFGMANISGNSMEPTLSHGDKVVVNKLAYSISEPEIGEIIAFPYKENPEESYVKRIIAAEGDEVDLIDGNFIVNGIMLDDDFSVEPTNYYGNIRYPFTVPAASYFVLGDNRNHSSDSRNTSVGCITKEDMIGKIAFRVLPLNDFGFIR